MTNIPKEIEDHFDPSEQQRTDRLGWVFYGVCAMILVLGNFFLQDRVENGIVQAFGLTILCYGSVLYVNEIKHIRELWLWKGVVATIPLHAAFILGLFWWDAKYPSQSGLELAWGLGVAFVVEMFFVLPIFERFRSSFVSSDAERNNIPQRPEKPLSQTWQAAADRLRGKFRPKIPERYRDTGARITLAGEEASDFGKEDRRSHVDWGFCGVAALVLLVYLFRGISIRGAWLYILKASLFTAFCYGHFLYVEEKEHIRESWVWKAVLVTIPFHVAFLGVILGIDKGAPYLASNAIVFLFVLWAFGWVETKLMGGIADDYQP